MNRTSLLKRRLMVALAVGAIALAAWALGLLPTNDGRPSCEPGRTVERAPDGTVTRIVTKTCAE